MPYVKLMDKTRPRSDELKGNLLERMRVERVSNQEMADAIGVSRSTFQRLLNQHTDEWTIGQITAAFHRVQMRVKIEAL